MDGMTQIDRWIDMCAVSDIPMRGARRVVVDALEIGIFRTSAGDIYAIDNRCPHKGGPLSDGIVHDTAVTCPLHGFVIDLSTGEARGADTGCVTAFTVDVRGDRVFVNLAQ